jgi:hypothetical protein
MSDEAMIVDKTGSIFLARLFSPKRPLVKASTTEH